MRELTVGMEGDMGSEGQRGENWDHCDNANNGIFSPGWCGSVD